MLTEIGGVCITQEFRGYTAKIAYAHNVPFSDLQEALFSVCFGENRP
jgi:hypothetical protein